MTLTHKDGSKGSIDVDLTRADRRQIGVAATTVVQAHHIQQPIQRLDPERIPWRLLARAVEDAMWAGARRA